jgi:3'-5' exoribonuclease
MNDGAVLSTGGEKLFISDIREGQEIEDRFLLEEVSLRQTRNGKPYLALKLKDQSGRMEARVWDRAEDLQTRLKSGEVCLLRGTAESFQGQIQLKVIDARALDQAEVDFSEFMPASVHGLDDMFNDLLDLVNTMQDPHLKGLVTDILNDPEIGEAFKRAPAAKRFHHAFLGGLLEHTLSVCRAAVAVAPNYPMLNRDLLLTGAVLHDLGKIREFDSGPKGDYTDEGRLMGHLIIGLKLVEEKLEARPDFPEQTALLVKHMILSHHGEPAMGAVKHPQILEALALHLLDDLDAKMNGLSDFIERHVDPETGWTDYNRLMERFFFRPDRLNEEESSSAQPDRAEMPGQVAVSRPKKRKREAEPAGAESETEPDPDQLSFLKE